METTITSPSGRTLRHVARRKTTSIEDSSAKKIAIENRQRKRLVENREYLKDKNFKAFLDTIAQTEGGDYDLKYGGVKGKKNDKWRITDFTTHPGPGADGKTTAAGRYQINKAAWKENGISAMGVVDFSAGTQDLIAVEILRRYNALDAIIAGDMSEALKRAARPWNSLPLGPQQTNRVSGQPYTEYSEVILLYKGNGGTATKE